MYGICKYKTSSNKYDSWNVLNRSSTENSDLGVLPTFGSSIGENLMGIRFIDNRKILLSCAGTNNGITYDYDSVVSSTLGNDMTFQYHSVVSGGTISGFAPQSSRELVSLNVWDLSALVTLIDENGNTSAYCSSFLEDANGKRIGGKLNPYDYSVDSIYNINHSDMMSLKSSIIQHAGISNGSVTTSKIAFYFVPDSSYSKSIAFVSAYNSVMNVGYIIISEVDVDFDGSNITNPIVFSTKSITRASVSGVELSSFVSRFPGLIISKHNGFNYIGVDNMMAFRIPGDVTFYKFMGKIKNGIISGNNRFDQTYYLQGNLNNNCVLPGVGFGLMNSQLIDYQTKAVLALYGNTESELDGMISGAANIKQNIVIVSQEVPEEYNLYVSQEVPVFIAGRFYKIPPASFDLTVIDPAPQNKTFYLYAEMDISTGVASYKVNSALLEESLTRVFIGTIITGNSSISSINTEKVTRFLTYRPSVTPRGSAIPCSTGVPSGGGTRWK